MEPLRSLYEDDPDMLEIVLEFASELPERVQALRSSFESADLEQLRTLAHQLKGAGGGYGFPQISEAAGSLEQALREGADEARIKQDLAALCELLQAVMVPEAS